LILIEDLTRIPHNPKASLIMLDQKRSGNENSDTTCFRLDFQKIKERIDEMVTFQGLMV